MGRNTEYLKMYLPNENDYYRVEEDQNQNFEKLDTKIKEIDNGISKIGNDKQDKTDNSLNTTNKTIVGAINKLNSVVDNNITSTIKVVIKKQSSPILVKEVYKDKDFRVEDNTLNVILSNQLSIHELMNIIQHNLSKTVSVIIPTSSSTKLNKTVLTNMDFRK